MCFLEDSELFLCTLVIVLCQVLLVYVEVMVSVQLPELAVDHIEMFIGEEFCQLVHVLFLLQQRHVLRQRRKKRVNFSMSFLLLIINILLILAQLIL